MGKDSEFRVVGYSKGRAIIKSKDVDDARLYILPEGSRPLDFSAKLTGVRVGAQGVQLTRKGGPPNEPVDLGLASSYPESSGLPPSVVNPAENARQWDELARQKISGREVRLTLPESAESLQALLVSGLVVISLKKVDATQLILTRRALHWPDASDGTHPPNGWYRMSASLVSCNPEEPNDAFVGEEDPPSPFALVLRLPASAICAAAPDDIESPRGSRDAEVTGLIKGVRATSDAIAEGFDRQWIDGEWKPFLPVDNYGDKRRPFRNTESYRIVKSRSRMARSEDEHREAKGRVGSFKSFALPHFDRDDGAGLRGNEVGGGGGSGKKTAHYFQSLKSPEELLRSVPAGSYNEIVVDTHDARLDIAGLAILMDNLPGDGTELELASLLSPDQEDNMESILEVLATFKKNRGAWSTPQHGVPQLFLINR
ncbi:hypothetical protein LXT21_39910 [Myxococcus sp. K38C18041901]|uniref:hypothetical protein n=1 Tax=Myxococcus guangdongensis TaxID=2906760 RepID=UPI0020A7A98A|nr:hypothetical protein [Myxococcus guangdongensis]MCP3064957.1 hypothetical protein [Myxococcus guangdongensis]